MLRQLFQLALLFLGTTNWLIAREFGQPDLPIVPLTNAIVCAIPEGRVVDTNTMQQVYDAVKTPFKYGVVLKGGSTNELVDCPSIFRSGGHWYMMYVAITNKAGYQTFLARSDDLLHWQKLGKILSFNKTNDWDAWQADGGIALADYRWDGTHELEKFDGKFWLSYIGGAKQGYETDPLSTGIAWTINPAKIKEWNRIPENPVLSPKQTDVREFERIRRLRNGVVHGMEEVDPADLHDAANRLHDIVEEIIRRSQQDSPPA